jgi:hypothetical protein
LTLHARHAPQAARNRAKRVRAQGTHAVVAPLYIGFEGAVHTTPLIQTLTSMRCMQIESEMWDCVNCNNQAKVS